MIAKRIGTSANRHLRASICVLMAALLVGCAGARAVNTPLEQYEPGYGYRMFGGERRQAGSVVLYLAFSGGGTRAAAFAYGVLEELRDTQVVVDGVSMSLLEEVDTISGVSGGSFPAAYYGLFGDQIFEGFEANFLKKNVQGALVLRTLAPWNLIRLATPWLTRSDLASSYYDEKVFAGATFASMHEAHGPWVHINATDLSSGDRFTFSQDNFDVICSDLDALSVSTAVAASSAVPMLLSPITLKNNAGSCGYDPPQWVKDVLADDDANPRRARSVKSFQHFRDADAKPYVHLVDGGISDNLGLRPAIDLVSAAGGAEAMRKIGRFESPDLMAVIVVNAETDPDPKIDLSSASPSFASLMNSVSGGQIRRYNFETIQLMETLIHEWGRELSSPEHQIATFVDRLRQAGRELLQESPDFERLLKTLQ